MDANLSSAASGEEILYELLTNQDDFAAEKKKAESISYLKELCSFNIDRLQLEPMRLKEEKDHINEEIQNLAYSNYKTFISTAQCSREIYQDFSVIDNKLDSLIEKIPQFVDKCDNFTKNIQTINASRRITNVTLQKHNQILEILEISQLMDTCVRNEYYEEALELSSYVKRLEKKFGPTIPLIQQIVDDVKQSLDLMLKQLLQQLKTNIQFPTCLKIIGLIRRLDIYNESQLRIKFLQLRECWLQKQLDNISKDDPYHYISKTIDEYRVHLFDIITQYKALFSDDELTTSSTNSNLFMFSSATSSGMLSTFNQRDPVAESKLFNCWILDKIEKFLQILREALKLGVDNRLDSVLSQAMYFGLAFSRVGLDFRVLIVQIIEEAAYDQLRNAISNANVKFEESMMRFNIADLGDVSSINDSIMLSNKKNSMNPPFSLIEFQPLAFYLNSLLQAFNDFRLCAPLTLVNKVKLAIEQSLQKLSSVIGIYLKSEQNTFDVGEKELVNKFLRAYAYELIPYIENCLNVLFPLQQLQTSFGIKQVNIEKVKCLLRLNEEFVFQPIKHLLPQKLVEAETVVEQTQKSDELVEDSQVENVEERETLKKTFELEFTNDKNEEETQLKNSTDDTSLSVLQ